MDQVIQLQQQLQRLHQEVQDINTICSQLQQSEQANALQLQQMTQKEMLASQGIRRIQQAAGQLSQEISQISSIAQQMTGQISPLQRQFQGAGAFYGAYGTGLAGQTGASFYPQTTGFSSNFTQPGTGILGGSQYGTFGQGQNSQFGYNQGQNLANLPTWSASSLSTLLHPQSQGYTPSQFGTGSQWGQSSQAFSNTGSSQYGSGLQNIIPGQSIQGSTQGLSNWGSSQFQPNLGSQQGFSSSNLMNTLSPVMQNTNLGMAGQGNNLGTYSQSSYGQSGSGTAGYSPYQSNQFGFR